MTAALATPIAMPSDRPVVLLLARIEAVRIVLHPAFVAGLLGSSLMAWRAVVTDADAAWSGAGYQTSMIAWAFAGIGTLLAAALATGRGRLLEDVELFEASPLPPARRVLALVVALAAPVGLVTLAVAAQAALVADRGGFRQADPPFSTGLVPVSALEWAQLPLAVLLAGLVGIAVASLPKARALLLVVVTTAAFLTSVAYWAVLATPLRVLHPIMFGTDAEPLPDDFSPSGWHGDRGLLVPDQYEGWREVQTHAAALRWHVVGVIGLCLLAAGVAMSSADRADRSDRHGRRLVIVGVVIAGGGLAAQLVVGA